MRAADTAVQIAKGLATSKRTRGPVLVSPGRRPGTYVVLWREQKEQPHVGGH